MKTSPLRVVAASEQTPMATMYLYDEIGPSAWGLVDSASVISALASLNGLPINLRINSPGGDVFEAFAIYNALARHTAGVTVDIDALAASAASVVAMAGRKIRIAENAMVMIHDPTTVAIGGADDMRQVADVLDQVADNIAGIYAARTELPLEWIKPAMAGETWLRAAEAVERGFADEIGQPLTVAANRGNQKFRNAPANLFAAPAQTPAPRLAAMRAHLAAVVSRNHRAKARAA
jgi:ATP-dependent protease ClpP protease subunit